MIRIGDGKDKACRPSCLPAEWRDLTRALSQLPNSGLPAPAATLTAPGI
jgi:hypothetical protein